MPRVQLRTPDYTDGSVTLPKIANIADGSILGNNTGSAAAPSALTIAQVLALGGLATSVTAGKTLTLAAADDYTLTVPATGAVDLLGVAQTITADKTHNLNSATALLVEQSGVHDKTLVVDTASGLIGIGGTPEQLLHLRSDVSAALYFDTSNNTSTLSPLFVMRKSRGTTASPTQTLSGNRLGQMAFSGYEATTPGWTGQSGAFAAYSEEAFTSTARGTYLRWETTPTGSITRAEGMRLTGAGNLLVGNTSIAARLAIQGAASGITAILRDNATTPGNTLELQNSSAGVNHSLGSTGAVFNEQGLATADFRVESDTEANMIFLDANADTDGALYLGGSTNGVKINKGGEISLIGTATTWDDLNFSPSSSGGAAASLPDYVTINNVTHREFTSLNNQSCGDSQELPHPYKLSSTIYPHVHIFLKSGESAGTTGVTFTLYWELRQSTGTTSGSVALAATSAELGTTAGANKFSIYDNTGFAGSAELGGQLAIKLARTAGDAGDVVVTTYGVHYEIDGFGSKTASAK